MSNEQPPPPAASASRTPPACAGEGERPGPQKSDYWQRELPPLDAEPLGAHTVDANSVRVTGRLDRRGDLWDRCYRDLTTRVEERLRQEVRRLGGDCAHVLEEAVDSRSDARSGEVWLRC